MSKLIPLLVLAACAPGTEANTPMPAPAQLTLSIDGVIEHQTDLVFSIEGAAPHQRIHLVVGGDTAPDASCPPMLGGACLDLIHPRALTQGRPLMADAQGRASTTMTVPSTVPEGAEAWFQAVGVANVATVSNTVHRFNPLDRGPMDLGLHGELRAGGHGSWEERYTATDPGFDLCTIRYEASYQPAPPQQACDDCLFAYEVEFHTPTETTTSGDCMYFFNRDVDALRPFTQSVAYHPNFYVLGEGYQPMALTWSHTAGDWVPVNGAFRYTGGVFAWSESVPSLYY